MSSTIYANYKAENNAFDIGGSAIHGTWVGTENYEKGARGNAFAFDGSSYIDAFPAGLDLFTGDFTFCSWMTVDTTTDVSPTGCLNVGTTTAFITTFNLTGTGSLRIIIRSETDSSLLDLSDVFTVGTSFHLTIAAKSSASFVVYVNAVEIGSASMPSGDRLVTEFMTPIGALGNRNNITREMDGQMDEVQFWKAFLKKQDVMAVYSGMEPSFLAL